MNRFLLILLAACAPATSEGKPAKPAKKPAPVATKKPPVVDKKPAEAPKPPSDPVAAAWVKAHNAARAKHCAPPLEWSPTIAKVAQSWANQLKAKGCMFGHSSNQKYGENLAAGTIGALDPESTVAMWYDEIKLYKFPNGGFSMKTGHFTQLVWTDTTEVGCGHVQCNGNDIYVCNYNPPGNWEGQYKEHVLSTSCKR